MSRLWLLLVLLLTGCSSSYTIRGRAIETGAGEVAFVDAGTRILEEARGISGVLVRVFRNPNRLDRDLLAQGRSDANGRIEIEITAFGVGWMEESWLIEVTRGGYESVESRLRLPSPRSDRASALRPTAGHGRPPVGSAPRSPPT